MLALQKRAVFLFLFVKNKRKFSIGYDKVFGNIDHGTKRKQQDMKMDLDPEISLILSAMWGSVPHFCLLFKKFSMDFDEVFRECRSWHKEEVARF